jgi:hypothetical protein
MQDLKAEIDEKTYLAGTSLNEALFKYASPKSIQNYKTLTNSRPPPVKGENTNTLLGALTLISDNFQNTQNHTQKTNDAIGTLYREILYLIKNGDLIPYSYQLPRKLSDIPIGIPIDMMLSGKINWENSELIYKDFEFTGIRLIEPLKKITEIPIGEINHQNHLKDRNPYRDSLKETPLKEINKNNSEKSFSDLDPELHIDEKRAAIYLGISPRTLQGYRTKGGGPEFVKISHKVVRYKIADLIKWTENKKRKNTSEK